MAADEFTLNLRRLVLQRLESLERAGVQILPRGKPATRAVPAAQVTAATDKGEIAPPLPGRQPAMPVASPNSAGTTIPPRPGTPGRGAGGEGERRTVARAPAASSLLPPDLPTATSGWGTKLELSDRAAALEVLRRQVAGCVKCKVLAQQRNQTVFGVGSPQARLVFFGEAPGADEDRLGEPFVGRAGQLLTKIIEACTLKREDVYILNVLKCRPPDNRPPEPDEVTNCRPFFERQLEIIQPEFICCLGASAARALLKTETSIGKLRGRFFPYERAEVLCTYHPSYLLRNPAAKRDVWEDMKILMGKMGVELA